MARGSGGYAINVIVSRSLYISQVFRHFACVCGFYADSWFVRVLVNNAQTCVGDAFT